MVISNILHTTAKIASYTNSYKQMPNFTRVSETRNECTQDMLTLLLLNTTCPVIANSVDPDQLASELDLHCLSLNM